MVDTEKIERVSAIQPIRPIQEIERYYKKEDRKTNGQAKKKAAFDNEFKEALEKAANIQEDVKTATPDVLLYYDSRARARAFTLNQTYSDKG